MLNILLNAAKTEEQKMGALAEIKKEMKKIRLTALIYGLIYFVNSLFLGTACIIMIVTVGSGSDGIEASKAFWIKLPGFITKILNACDRWNEWIVSASKGIWLIYPAVVALVTVAVPSITIWIAKAIIVITSRNESRPLNRTLPEYFKETYKLVNRYSCFDNKDYAILACISSAIGFIISLFLFLWWGALEDIAEGIKGWELWMRMSGVMIILVLPAALFYRFVMPLLVHIPSKIAARGQMTITASDLSKFEEAWAEVAPKIKTELERRREEERRRRLAKYERERQKQFKKKYGFLPSNSSSSNTTTSGSYIYPSSSGTEMSDAERRRRDDEDFMMDLVMQHMEQEYGPDWGSDL